MTTTHTSTPTKRPRKPQRRRILKTICQHAATPASWHMADRLAKAMTGCGCNDLGAPEPPTMIEQAIAEGDAEWLQVCAPDQVADLDEDVQDRLFDQLIGWGGEPDW